MDHVALMRIRHGVADRGHDPHDLGDGEFLPDGMQGFEFRLQRLARHVLQHHVEEVAVMIEVVDLDDVRVPELGDRRGLLLEAPRELRIAGEVRVDQFDRHRPAQVRVGAFIHRRHPALAEKGFNLVPPANRLSDPTGLTHVPSPRM